MIPTSPLLYVAWESELVCPACGDVMTHLDRVEITQASGLTVAIDLTGEDRKTEFTMLASVTPQSPEQRRHTITIVASCESCDGFSISFRQHKGSTFAHVATPAQ